MNPLELVNNGKDFEMRMMGLKFLRFTGWK